MEPVDNQGVTFPPEEAPADASADASSASVAALPPRGKSRRVVSWAAVLALVLVVALITTTLIASRHVPSNSTSQGHAAATTTSKLPPSLGIYGLAQPAPALDDPLSPGGVLSTPAGQNNGSVFALNAAGGSLRWQYRTPDAVEAGQAVADGVVYTGSTDGTVYAFDARTGKLRWSVRLLQQSEVQQVADGVVYVGASDGSESSQPVVFALDARSGKQLWQFTGGSGVDLIAGGTVYVSAGDVTQTSGTIYALDARTGAERWHFQGQGSLSTESVAGGTVYVTGFQLDDSADPSASPIKVTLYALDASTGAPRWSYPKNPSDEMSLAGVANGMAYLFVQNSLDVPSYAHTLVALNAVDGSVRWRAQIPPQEVQFTTVGSGGTITSTTILSGSADAMLSGGVIYIGNTSDQVSAYDASTGKLLWSDAQVGDEILQDHSIDTVADGVVYVNILGAAADAGLYALNASSGKLLWKQLGKSLFISAVVDGVVFASSFDLGPPFTPSADDNGVYALNASTGALLWSYNLGKDTATITAQ